MPEPHQAAARLIEQQRRDQRAAQLGRELADLGPDADLGAGRPGRAAAAAARQCPSGRARLAGPLPGVRRRAWRVSGEALDPDPAEADGPSLAPVPVEAASVEPGPEPEPETEPFGPDARALAPPLSPPHDGLLLPAVHALITPFVERARRHGPTPPNAVGE